MMNIKQIVLTVALTVGLSGMAQAGGFNSNGFGFDYEESPSGEEMWADAVIVRPIMLGYTALGLAWWVVTLPFSIPAGNADASGEAWVTGPLKYTFMRPLGEMEEGVEPSYVQQPVASY